MSHKQLNIPRQISNTLNSVNKTISENKELKINVNSNIVLEKDDTLNLPSISNIFNYDDMRGAADSFALKKKYHDEKLLNQITSKNKDIKNSLKFTFLNKCDESEIDIYKEYFQRTFAIDI